MIAHLGWVAGVALFLAALVATLLGRWAIEDRPTLHVAAAFLLCQGTGAVILTTPAATVPLLRLTANIAGQLAVFWLLMLFCYALYDQPRRWIPLLVAPPTVSITIALSTWLLHPDEVFRALLHGGPTHSSAPLLFDTAILTYLLVGHSWTAGWSLAYARRCEQRASRVGFTLLAAGFATLTALMALRVLPVMVAFSGVSWSPTRIWLYDHADALGAAGYALIAAGVGCPAIVRVAEAVPMWRTHRSTYLQLQPLSALLYQAFPMLALGPVPGASWHEMITMRRTHYRFYRRLIEILEQLVQIRPFYSAAVVRQAHAAAQDAGLRGEQFRNRVWAEALIDAVRTWVRTTHLAEVAARGQCLTGEDFAAQVKSTLAEAALRRITAEHAYPVFDTVAGATLAEDAQQMVALSQAVATLTRRGNGAAATAAAAAPVHPRLADRARSVWRPRPSSATRLAAWGSSPTPARRSADTTRHQPHGVPTTAQVPPAEPTTVADPPGNPDQNTMDRPERTRPAQRAGLRTTPDPAPNTYVAGTDMPVPRPAHQRPPAPPPPR